VIGADTFSTILDPADRTTRAIFGDGAGAVVLRRGSPDEPGALGGFDLGSDGHRAELIMIPGGGSRQRSSPGPTPVSDTYFTMEGKAVFMQAVVRMSESAQAAMRLAGCGPDDVDRLVAHQANQRILAAVADQLSLGADQVVSNIAHVGNTVAASIPLALADGVADGQLRPGHRVLLTAFGGGLTWGSAVVRWPDIPVLRSVDQPTPRRKENTIMQPLEQYLATILTDRFGIPADDIEPTITFDELAVDSLIIVELALVLRKDLDVDLSDTDLKPNFTIREAADFLTRKGAALR